MRPGQISLRFVTACLLACGLPVIGQSFPNSYGVLRPDDPRPFVGDNLTLFCNLTKRDLVENSTRLFFRRDGELVPPHYVDIINSRNVRLRYPIRQPQDEGLFTCILNRTRGEQQPIGSQRVLADYRPAKVESLDCVVNNWESMTCSWDLGRDFNHLDKINVSLVWVTSGEQRDCPVQTKTTCQWTSREGGDFQKGALYIMSVEVRSYLDPSHTVKESSSVMHIDTGKIVKPAPVENLSSRDRNATCLLLTWSHSAVESKMAVVEYQSEWLLGVWQQVNVTDSDDEVKEVLVCGLTPFTTYTVRVAVWPLHHGRPQGNHSDWQYKIERTSQAVPEVAPEMCSGCFTDLPCESEDCRHLIVYWQPIPDRLRYSIVGNYHLRVMENNQVVETYNVSGTDTSCFLRLSAARAYTVQLYAVTELGALSLAYATIHLGPQTPPHPRFFVVETDNVWSSQGTHNLYLTWSRDRDTANYTVFWCRGSKLKFKCDIEDNIHWQSFAASSTNYTLSVEAKGRDPDDFLVGLSRQVVRQESGITSSGIQWSRCFYQRNTKPVRVNNVRVGAVRQEASLQVSWDPLVCPDSNSYVSNYTIMYCNTTSHNHNICEGPTRNVTVEGGTSGYILKDLNPGAYVRVEVAAGSQSGQGPLSDPVYFPVPAPQQAEEPNNFSIIGVVIGVIVLLVLILVCICKLRGKYRKGLEKFGAPRDPSPVTQSKPLSSQCHPMKDRPLPKLPLPPVCSSAAESGTPVLAEGARGNGRRMRNGKHESITSETSLLGHEERTLEHEDTRRRHRSGASVTSEKTKLLPADSPGRDTLLTSRRYSGDHDYASVDSSGGSSSSSSSNSGGNSGDSSGSDSAQASGGSDVSISVADVQRYLQYANPAGQRGARQSDRAESGNSDDECSTSAASALTRREAERSGRGQERKLSYPCSLPPPKPPPRRQGSTHAAPPRLDHMTMPRSAAGGRAHEDRQPLMTTFGRGHKDVLPGLPAASFRSDRTLPLPPVEKSESWRDANPTAADEQAAYSKVDVPAVSQGQAAAHSLHHAASSFCAAGSKAPRLGPKHGMAAAQDGVAASLGKTFSDGAVGSGCGSSGGGGGGVAGGGGEAESIYSPPWDSKGLAPFVATSNDNRPLSEYMLQLPSQFFSDTSLRCQPGPTTEL